MTEASRVKHTGWGPFVLLTREHFEPRPIDGNVEAWIGRPVQDRAARDPWHCDFWRVHPSGLLFLLRGYAGDSSNRVEPATILDITMPIWMVGEAMLYASRPGPAVRWWRPRHFGALPLLRIAWPQIGLPDPRAAFLISTQL
jgi:hypothetical protein